jgi:hypothetical protein
MVVWTSDTQDGSNFGVFGQRFQPTTAPQPIPALSSVGEFLLGVLLVGPMLWSFRRRVVGSSPSFRE